MAHFVALSGTPLAPDSALVFIKEVVCLHGVPSDLVTDCAIQFTSRFWRALRKFLHIGVSLSLAYYSQMNSQTERTNQTLEQYLRCFTSYMQDN